MDIDDETTDAEAHESREAFVQNWLLDAVKTFPESPILEAVSDSTKLGRLDEAKLVKRVRKLAKASKDQKAT